MNENNETPENQTSLVTRRYDLELPDAFHAWLDSSAKQMGLTPEGMVEYLVQRQILDIEQKRALLSQAQGEA